MENRITTSPAIKLELSICKHPYPDIGNACMVYPLTILEEGYHVLGKIPIVVDIDYVPIATRYALELTPLTGWLGLKHVLDFLNIQDKEFEAMYDDEFLLEAGLITE